MRAPITTIGFDADDTLWQNERYFRMTEARFADLLAGSAEREHLAEHLRQIELRNLGRYGFGVKGFTLSMIETALEATGQSVPGRVIAEIIACGQEMLAHPVELLPHVHATIQALARSYRIVLITKGDLVDQERKLAQSGLGELFNAVEIVSAKTPDTYIRAFMRHGDGPERAMMVGNSMRSDILPALDAGAWGVHVPQEVTWGFEQAASPRRSPRFFTIPDLAALPAIVADLTP